MVRNEQVLVYQRICRMVDGRVQKSICDDARLFERICAILVLEGQSWPWHCGEVLLELVLIPVSRAEYISKSACAVLIFMFISTSLAVKPEFLQDVMVHTLASVRRRKFQ